MKPSEYTVHPALCIDFDGTIRYTKHGTFIKDAADISLFPDVETILWDYRNKGYLILGITNQGGVAYGFRTLEQAQEELNATLVLFRHNPFHVVQVCLFHEGGNVSPFNHRSLLRKPETGMLAVCEVQMFNQGMVIDWDHSIFVGDRPEDEDCANRAGIKFIPADIFFKRSV